MGAPGKYRAAGAESWHAADGAYNRGHALGDGRRLWAAGPAECRSALGGAL